MPEEITADLQSKCPLSHAMPGSCDHNGGTLISEHGDLKLTIPEGAIKDGDVVTFAISSDLYGPFVLPSKSQADLASPYYWIGVGESYHFHEPVQVEFEHFAVVITPCDPSHYQLLTCEDDDKSYIMRPVDYYLHFKVHDNISLCAFNTKHFYAFCLYHNCKDPMVSRVAALYLKPDNFQYLTRFTVEIWFSFHVTHCLKTHKTYYERKWMILDASCNFETSCDKSSTSSFTLNYNNDFDGWEIEHSKSRDIRAYEINFYNYYASMEALMESGENSLYPPHFIVNVVRKSECTKDLNTALNVSLSEEEKADQVILFKLHVSISALLSQRQENSLLLVDSDHDHIGKQNKLELAKEHITKSHDSASIALPDTGEGNIYTNKRNAYLGETHNGLSPGTDKDNEHTKDENAILQPASLDTCEDGGHKNHDTVDLEQLIIFIKNDLPHERLMLFVSKLLCDDVIKDIRRKGKMTVESICKAAFVKEDPEASCMKISFALEQAGCDDLAKNFHACFCKP